MAADVNLVKAKVQQYLTEAAGRVSIDQDGDFSISYDSARAFVRVMPHPNGQAVLVNVFAHVLVGVPPTAEFFKFVATYDELIFGTFYAAERPDGTCSLVLRQMLLGDYLDKDELLYVALGVVSAADKIDDELAAKFGGHVFHD